MHALAAYQVLHIDAPGAAAADEPDDAFFSWVSTGSSWTWELTRFLITIRDLVAGDFTFTDTAGQAFRGGYGLVPVHTLRAGCLTFPALGHPAPGAGCPRVDGAG